MKWSRTPTVVLTANGEVHTHEEAQVSVHDPNLFVNVQLLEETSAVLALRKLYEDHGHSYEWVSGQKPRLTKDGKSIICKTDNFVPLVVPELSTNSESVSSSMETGATCFRFIFRFSTVAKWRNSIQGNWCDRPKTQNKKRRVRDLPEWLEEFKENLVDTELPAPHTVLTTQI